MMKTHLKYGYVLILRFCDCQIWEDICSGKVEEDSSVLLRFLVISFADLKKWSFHYWFAFPALILDPPATVVKLKPAAKWFSVEEVLQILIC